MDAEQQDIDERHEFPRDIDLAGFVEKVEFNAFVKRQVRVRALEPFKENAVEPAAAHRRAVVGYGDGFQLQLVRLFNKLQKGVQSAETE